MPMRVAFVTVMAIMGLGLGLGSGCASLAAVTSGHVGCPEEEIRIYNDRQGWGTRSWSARCRGRIYHCIGVSGGKYSAPHISCKGEPRSSASYSRTRYRRPTSAGCQYDKQCKGDRICRAGRCVDASSRTSGTNPAARRGTSPGPAAAPLPRPVIQVSFAQRMGITLGEASKHGAAMGLVARSGAVVLSVQRGGAASRRRIRRGDVIMGLATSRVKKVADVVRLGRSLKPGQKFHIVVKRGSRIFSFYMKF